jgi:hypothetical protein
MILIHFAPMLATQIGEREDASQAMGLLGASLRIESRIWG